MTTVSVEDVIAAGNLIPLDEAMTILSTTEPLDEYSFALDGSDAVKFTLPDGWNEEVKGNPPTFVTDCSVDIGGTELGLTSEAILKMTSSIGLTKDYVLRTPGALIEPQLNWWVQNGGVKGAEGMRLLAKDGVGTAFIKSSLVTFANLPMVERVVDRIYAKFGPEALYVDYKMAHSLERTALRIIVPSYSRTIESARGSAAKPDNWSLGLQYTNSLMAHPETKLAVSGYLFAWWCTNGAISTHATSGNYNRRVSGQEVSEVLAWLGECTDTIFEDLDHELDAIASLTEVSLDGELNDVVQDLFRQYHIPKMAHQSVIDNLVDSDDLTGYGLMQALTQTANEFQFTDNVRERLMAVGGALPGSLTDRCDSCHRVKVS